MSGIEGMNRDGMLKATSPDRSFAYFPKTVAGGNIREMAVYNLMKREQPQMECATKKMTSAIRSQISP